jgi:non-specific serine/threonine protein kinase
MERREAYRVQVSWDGSRFVLYLRSLLSGVLDSPVGLWELPYLTKRTVLVLPAGRQEITAYALGPSELVSALLETPEPYPLGRDAQWTRALLRWILSLYDADAWYPEVRRDQIRLRLLVDSVEATEGLRGFRETMPPSFRAALPGEPTDQLWNEVLSALGDAVGWALLWEGPVSLRPAWLSRLPEGYQSLLELFAEGARHVSSSIGFFDPRQANLTLPERSSRLAFLISPPEPNQPFWQLRPQLQSLRDSEESCDALLGWQDPRTIPPHFLRAGTSPRFHLLREFGRALRVFPDLGASLASSPPAPLRYDPEQMAAFLKNQAESLQAYGYPLLAPPNLARPHAPQVTLQIDPGNERQGLDIGQLLDFSWSLAVDEALLDLAALQAWADNPGPLIFSRGRWFWVDPKSTLKALRFMQKQPRSGTLLEAMALAGGSQPLRLELGGQLSPLHQQQKFEERNEPPGFHGTLRAYQRRGYSWLLFMRKLGLGACLADDMGLGKTVQTLAALLSLKDQGQLALGLLVCPTTVLGNWLAEAKKFTPGLRVLLHHGQRFRDPEMFAQAVAGYDLVVTSYPLLTRDRKSFLGQNWDVVVLDEAQQIKNSQTQAAKVARELTSGGRILLTGTPVENRLEDLWSLFRFLQPELLESHRGFVTRFARPIEKRGDMEAKEQLRRLVGPFILRRLKTDPKVAPELPSKIETVVACSLTPEQAKTYQIEVEAALASVRGLEGIQRRGAILRLLTRLKQLCDHPALLEDKPNWDDARAGKLHRLYEIFEELPQDEGILIFSQFSRMVRGLQSLLTRHLDEEVLAFDGATPRHLRDQMIARFQSGRGPRLFIISLKSGGVGLNLTRASTVVHYDRWWNPAVETQATDRAFRIGQERHVQVFKLSTQGTLEEQIDRILTEKLSLVTGLIEEGDSWLTDLDDNELARLLLPGGLV